MSKAYKVTLGADITGQKKAVLFAHGVGLLDARTHFEQFQGMYKLSQTRDGKPEQQTGPTIETFAEYWRKQGAEVVEITAEEADSLRETISKRPVDLKPKAPAAKKTDEPKTSPGAKPAADDEPVDPKPVKDKKAEKKK